MLINLLLNACDALDARTGHYEKRIAVKASLVEGHVPPRICITVEDNGVGIREENLSRIFDAFFTTKDGVKDVGLGLSVCYGFVEEHGGDIHVRSRVGEGTTFSVILPVAQEGGG